MKTIIANLKYAERSQQATNSGSGDFSPKELGAAGRGIEKMLTALETIAAGQSSADAMVALARQALADAAAAEMG